MPTLWHSSPRFNHYFLYQDTLSYNIANSSTRIDKSVSLYTHSFEFPPAHRVVNKTNLSPEKSNVSQNMLAKQAKFSLKNRKYPVEVMSNPLKGSNNESKISTSHGSKTKNSQQYGRAHAAIVEKGEENSEKAYRMVGSRETHNKYFQK